MSREDTHFISHGSRCAAWLFRPAGAGPHPCVVMAHGFGAVREARLDAFGERFAQAGIAALVFDYRGFGASEGAPRQWLTVPRQLEDYDAAIAHARGLGGIDPKRIALWGSSFSGGHVLTLGARRRDIAAIVAQAPAADLLAAVLRVPPWTNLRLFIVGLIDLLGAALGARPRHVAVVGAPGALAVMSTPDADPGYRAMLPTPNTWRNEICARAVVSLALYRPVARAARISAPLLVCACDGDVVTPPQAAVRAAQRAPQGRLLRYPIGHFDIYRGAGFERAVADQAAFLRETLRVA
jgi:dienelactone hydrolase